MKFPPLTFSFLLVTSFFLFVQCSEKETTISEVIEMEEEILDEDSATDESTGNDNPNDTTTDSSDTTDTTNETSDEDQGNTTSPLSERFEFIGSIVIENSWNTGGCDGPPCDTDDESLDNFFDAGEPNDPYFYLADDESELFLECQLEKGRRIEFKQRSEGPLTSSSKMEFIGTYYNIPNGGMTIAQVHNRGGSSNKPFFRLELHADKLETVIRKDPEVSSSNTSFDKVDYSFLNNENYDQTPLTVVLEKGGGKININVIQNGMVILEQSFEPEASTRWVTNTGIANGYYLKAGLYNAAVTHSENLVLGYSTFKFSTDDQ